MKKKFIATVLGAFMIVGAMTGCGSASTQTAGAEVVTAKAADKGYRTHLYYIKV